MNAPERRDCRNVKLTIAYDGSDFCGWQRQAGRPSVQGLIEAALAVIHKHPVPLTGSGRTDSGVHAAGQAANFYTDLPNMPAPRFVPALNSLLPQTVRILQAEEVPQGFHARFDARSRLYRYFFITGRDALPAERPYALVLRKSPRLTLLNDYARLFRGEMDCSAFSSSGDSSRSRSRCVYHACFFREADKLVFEIRANAFLWKMVRTVAGTLLLHEERGSDPEELRRIIRSGRRAEAGPALPPKGLFLWRVDYGNFGCRSCNHPAG